jgi:DNA-binding GntR family transcriptional regulator
MMRAASRSRPRDIADLIAWDIQSGVLTPGMWLKQIDLEKHYKRSRGDVRRALDRLVEKRLVQHIPNRGYHVYAPDGRQAAELRDIRVILETAAVDGIIASASPSAIERVRSLARRFADLIPTGTVLEQYEANIAFHVELLALCPNRELRNLVMELRGRNSAAPASQWKTRARIEQSSREHLAMVDALAAGDGARLRQIIALHILQPEARSGTEAEGPASKDADGHSDLAMEQAASTKVRRE